MFEFTLPVKVVLWAVPVIFAITLHEVAHGWVARYFGDNTARDMGRLSMNPFRHVDPLGSIVVPVAMMWLSSFVFGWARPVPVNFQNLNNPRRDMILVALAGPFANFLMSLFWAFIMMAGLWLFIDYEVTGNVFVAMGAAGVFINTAVMMFNLLPLPPLDGGRILIGLLPKRYAGWLSRLEPMGLPILILLIFAGVAGKLVWPLMVLGMAVSTYLAAVPVDVLTGALGIMLGAVK